ncbi:MAG: CocE/NonD family hydrolase, partial [Pseudomonadota bacterium]|nr:CocE/NonD family hydrolase [Pseudomonadota bacterium]
MADTDSNGKAWLVPPSEYLARRPAEFECPATPFSLYVSMPDGCRIAVDVYLPQEASSGPPPGKVPALLILTPYYRRFRLKDGAPPGTETTPNAARYRDFFVPRGYALVVVDVRGTGASFGTRDSFRSPRERDDYREIATWIVAQPWSNGVVGATGISYLGAAALFLASTGHPAVKAVAPLFAVWNTYVDHFYPGGVLLSRLAAHYDEMMVALDHDRRDLLPKFPYFKDPNFAGPQPVDDDRDGSLLRAAVREHLANFRMPDFITEFRFTDDRLPYDPSFGAPSFSPYHYADRISEDVAIYSISGWMDGAGFANGSIARFLSLPNERRHLLLGPWDHGARANVSPFRDVVEPRFPVLAEVLRFFDQYLMGRDTGLVAEAPVHYFSIREEVWRSASSWPPVTDITTLFLDEGATLSGEPGRVGEDAYKVDFTLGTGRNTRYERLAGEDTREYYQDWQERDERMLRYTSEPLVADAEVSGHPVVDLWLASSEGDADVHVYLSEVEADGTVRYVTEGVLRAIHRNEANPERLQRWSWPFRTFARADARPMPPGRPEKIRFALLPTSWCFKRGSRIRLSIAGADADHYAQVPHGRPPMLTVQRGGAMASS